MQLEITGTSDIVKLECVTSVKVYAFFVPWSIIWGGLISANSKGIKHLKKLVFLPEICIWSTTHLHMHRTNRKIKTCVDMEQGFLFNPRTGIMLFQGATDQNKDSMQLIGDLWLCLCIQVQMSYLFMSHSHNYSLPSKGIVRADCSLVNKVIASEGAECRCWTKISCADSVKVRSYCHKNSGLGGEMRSHVWSYLEIWYSDHK